MAIGKGSDFKIRDDFFNEGRIEVVDQAVDGIASGSRGAILIGAANHRGDYKYDAFFQEISGAVTRRDLTSTSSVTPLAMTQDENISVKINRKVGPIEQTLNSFSKIAMDPEEMSFLLGRKHAEWKLQDMLNTGLIAVETALDGQTTNEFDGQAAGSPTTLAPKHLNSALSKLNDRRQAVVSWVVHGKPDGDYAGQTISDNVTDVASFLIREDRSFYLGRPALVTDAPALTDANGSLTDTYNTLGLVPGALSIEESENEVVAFELSVGGEQLTYVYQAEYAFSIAVKGFAYNVSGGGANPTDATLGTTSNWTKVATSYKDLAGVRLLTE